MKRVCLPLPLILIICRPALGQDDRPLKVEPNKENVVASRLEGSWESDAALCKRMGVPHNARLSVEFASDPDVAGQVPAKFRARLAGTRIYMAGRMTRRRNVTKDEHPFLLISHHGNAQILYFRVRDDVAMGDAELINVTVARAASRPRDVLLLGGDFNNQPFTPLRRATPKAVVLKGSDILVNLAQKWAERYAALQRQPKITVAGGGSGTGLSALLHGTAHVAMTSRAIRETERQRAAELGIELREVHVAADALAVMVHKDNPIESLTVDNLAAMYGDAGKLARWSQLRTELPGVDDDSIVLVSRATNSGTALLFKRLVLGAGGKFRGGVINTSGSKDAVSLVGTTATAIGYASPAYTDGQANVRVVPIAGKDLATPALLPPVMPDHPRYPLVRPMYLYVRADAPTEVRELLDWVLGEQGQTIVRNVGYAPARKD